MGHKVLLSLICTIFLWGCSTHTSPTYDGSGAKVSITVSGGDKVIVTFRRDNTNVLVTPELESFLSDVVYPDGEGSTTTIPAGIYEIRCLFKDHFSAEQTSSTLVQHYELLDDYTYDLEITTDDKNAQRVIYLRRM